jgi:hypothetical protein
LSKALPGPGCLKRTSRSRAPEHALESRYDCDALAVLIETLDLLNGLRRAQRLWLSTLNELAGWWPTGR